MMEKEIMCTLTAKQILEQEQLVDDMCRNGMRAVRINTAHLDTAEQLGELAQHLKSRHSELRVLIDTKGPEMRTTSIADDRQISLEKGMSITVQGCRDDAPTTAETIRVNYPLLHTETAPGDLLLIDDGKIALKIDSIEGEKISATVTEPGVLGSRKGLAVKGKDMNLPALSERDRMMVSYAAQSQLIDVIAHSFVRCAADVRAVKEAMGAGCKPIVAKIENQQGIDNLTEIIAEADGILIARGDLTASIGAANIPAAQQLIARETKKAGKPLYLATNILRSMMHQPHPDDADLRGIAEACAQGVDVLLLTNETASGPHPALCVSALRVAQSAAYDDNHI